MIFIPKWRLEWRSARSSGPGGQGVNKTESKAELRFHVDTADWIPEPVRERLKRLSANRINKEGEIIIASEVHRSQLRNQDEAFRVLEDLLAEAEKVPKKRIKTKATRGSQRRRLESKKRVSSNKQSRGKVRDVD